MSQRTTLGMWNRNEDLFETHSDSETLVFLLCLGAVAVLTLVAVLLSHGA